jgi:hypothetical protein
MKGFQQVTPAEAGLQTLPPLGPAFAATTISPYETTLFSEQWS